MSREQDRPVRWSDSGFTINPFEGEVNIAAMAAEEARFQASLEADPPASFVEFRMRYRELLGLPPIVIEPNEVVEAAFRERAIKRLLASSEPG